MSGGPDVTQRRVPAALRSEHGKHQEALRRQNTKAGSLL